jgi:hypothetical protein
MGLPVLTKKARKATRKDLAKEQKDFLVTYRALVKHQVIRERARLNFHSDNEYPGDMFTPICPICKKPVYAGSMHEVFITRGDAMGMPFEIQMQIYVPWNVVLLHEGDCHLKAQHTKEGKIACAIDIMRHYPADEIYGNWLIHMGDYMSPSHFTETKNFIMEVDCTCHPTNQ